MIKKRNRQFIFQKLLRFYLTTLFSKPYVKANYLIEKFIRPRSVLIHSGMN